MNKLSVVFFVAFFIAVTSCNNTDKNKEKVTTTPKEQADSLEKQVLEGHDIAMPKYMKIPDLQKAIKQMIDSVGQLPAEAQKAAAPYKAKLENISKELAAAYSSMENWMNEFNYDSARSNIEQRIKYLTDEKLKVDKVKETVLGSLQKAESFLKEKR